jgi:hypothetical protein
MLRVGKCKTVWAVLLMLHLMLHPALHAHALPEQSGAPAATALRATVAPGDVCSLCRAADSLQLPGPHVLAGEQLFAVGRPVARPSGPLSAQSRRHSGCRAPPSRAI